MKRTKRLSGPKGQQGQLSLFFAITLIFFITCLAFVINVGLFVKAKINLQNSVDAAAWSGAAVQARQLSAIAYLNWEMRNNYKEWLFKYYVLGQLANPRTSLQRLARNGTNKVDFRLPSEQTKDAETGSGGARGDYFNVPSVCIKPSGNDESNICAIYHVPGVPRFPPIGLTGVDDTLNEFTNVVVNEKTKDCTVRTTLNFVTTLIWAYGGGSANRNSMLKNAYKIAWDRPGVWVKGIELAMRVRNLEKFVNASPKSNLCAGGGGCNSIQNFNQMVGDSPANERTVKAFWAGFRNLENNDAQMDLKRSFRLTELAPLEVSVSKENLNGYLMPSDSTKYYLDLYLNVVNYVSFYSLFLPRTGSAATGTGSANVLMEGACPGVKTALPVPSLPIGYFKNPEVLTYYAVKGEASYTGIFNPFSNAIKMSAYAAAKPFGGRIGPILFRIDKNTASAMFPRQGSSTRTYGYISGINARPPPVSSGGRQNEQILGYPIPSLNTGNFWISGANSAVGGRPTTSSSFGVPNIVYDLVNMDQQQGGATYIQTINAEMGEPTRTPSILEAGLYAKDQYIALRRSLPGEAQNIITQNLINEGVLNSRRPTKYDALNYLIPTRPSDASNPSFITESGPLTIYAPLWSDNSGTDEKAESFYALNNIRSIINSYLRETQSSMNSYMRAMKFIADGIIQDSNTLNERDLGSNKQNYIEAANNLYNPQNPCKSIAGQFWHFLYAPSCPGSKLLEEIIEQFWREQRPVFRTHHLEHYANNTELSSPKTLMTAYLPGPSYGASAEGILPHPFLGDDDANYNLISDRNYYSTKFIPVASLASSSKNGHPPYIGPSSQFTSFSEGSFTLPDDLSSMSDFINPLASELLEKTGKRSRIRPIRE